MQVVELASQATNRIGDAAGRHRRGTRHVYARIEDMTSLPDGTNLRRRGESGFSDISARPWPAAPFVADTEYSIRVDIGQNPSMSIEHPA